MKPTIEELEATLNLFKNAVKILDVKSDKPAVLSLNDCNAVCFALTQAIAIEKGESVVSREMRLTIEGMAKQKLSNERTDEYTHGGDFVYGYDEMVKHARKLKSMINAAQEGAKDE